MFYYVRQKPKTPRDKTKLAV